MSIPKNDPEYRRLRRITQELSARIDLDKANREVLTLHESRKTLGLAASSKRYDPQYVYDAVQTDMAYRGRLVTLIKKVSNTVALLNQAMKAFRSYALTEYRDELGRTQGDRQAAIDRYCRPALDFIAECEEHVAGIEIVIKDIDQGGFAYARLVDLLKLMHDKAGIRNV